MRCAFGVLVNGEPGPEFVKPVSVVVSGGAGRDDVVLRAANADQAINGCVVGAPTTLARVSLGAGDDTLSVSDPGCEFVGAGAGPLFGWSPRLGADGGPGADTLRGGQAADTITGG